MSLVYFLFKSSVIASYFSKRPVKFAGFIFDEIFSYNV